VSKAGNQSLLLSRSLPFDIISSLIFGQKTQKTQETKNQPQIPTMRRIWRTGFWGRIGYPGYPAISTASAFLGGWDTEVETQKLCQCWFNGLVETDQFVIDKGTDK
jgi:hypothetical protein